MNQQKEFRTVNMLIIRFSAMGDVVLTVPVIKSLLNQFPELQITVLTKPMFKPFFDNIARVNCYPVDLKNRHKGLKGLKKLSDEIIEDRKIDIVIDLHSVLRTWIIDFLLRLRGVKVFKIDKGRKEKKIFVQKKDFKKLKHTTERYRETFFKAGFKFDLDKEYLSINNSQQIKSSVLNIGIAPFAAHKSKQWGTDKIYELIEKISAKKNVAFYLFGGGKQEVEELEKIASYYDNVFNLAGKITFSEEIEKIAEMSVFVSMDSGNMHIASLTGIPVISIWGGTHPDIGFSSLYQPYENHIQIQVSELPCRPCSVFGTSTCKIEKPFACMRELEVNEVLLQLNKYL